MSDIKKVFISYSWDDDEHQKWVRRLADDLIQNGVFVYLDQYDVLAGAHMIDYMERSIENADHVLVILTPNYKIRAENKVGGVGYEYSICNRKFFEQQTGSRKFFPILRNGDVQSSVPDFLKSLVRIDLTSDIDYGTGLRTILGNIYIDLRNSRPVLGEKPSSIWEVKISKAASYSDPVSDFEPLVQYSGVKGPLVLFLGPVGSGKTVALIRLIKYLREMYKVSVMKGFRYDSNYHTVAENFESYLYDQSLYAPSRTGKMDHVLLDLYDFKTGKPVCQFLDLAGEYFMEYERTPPFLRSIYQSSFEKIFIIFIDYDESEHSSIRLLRFSESIRELLHENFKKGRDKLIILNSKCDLGQNLFTRGMPLKKVMYQRLTERIEFRPFFYQLENLGMRYKDYIPFSSGSFNSATDGRIRWVMSSDYYPKSLWSNISKHLSRFTWW